MAKILRFGRTRTQIGMDVYNLTNSSAIQTCNQTYGARYLTPTLVLPARFCEAERAVRFLNLESQPAMLRGSPYLLRT